MKLHERIKAARVAAGMTQGGVAEAIGLSHAAVGHWETPNDDTRTTPHWDNLCLFAEAVGADVMQLLGWDNVPGMPDPLPKRKGAPAPEPAGNPESLDDELLAAAKLLAHLRHYTKEEREMILTFALRLNDVQHLLTD